MEFYLTEARQQEQEHQIMVAVTYWRDMRALAPTIQQKTQEQPSISFFGSNSSCHIKAAIYISLEARECKHFVLSV